MKRSTTYFNEPGRKNFSQVIRLVVSEATKNNIRKLVLFSATISSVQRLFSKIDSDTQIIVATYSYNRKFTVPSPTGDETIIPESTLPETRQIFEEMGIKYVQGGLPFENITRFSYGTVNNMIISTYDTISKGISLCVSAAIMAYEQGYISDGESVIALAADTAIIVQPTAKRDMFSGDFHIDHIICRPK